LVLCYNNKKQYNVEWEFFTVNNQKVDKTKKSWENPKKTLRKKRGLLSSSVAVVPRMGGFRPRSSAAIFGSSANSTIRSFFKN
jgi:hypothetical protein